MVYERSREPEKYTKLIHRLLTKELEGLLPLGGAEGSFSDADGVVGDGGDWNDSEGLVKPKNRITYTSIGHWHSRAPR